MARIENFSALTISTLRIRLTRAALTITVDEVADIQVAISGEHPDSVKLRRQDGILSIAQSLHPGHKISEVLIILPMDWKGAVDASTLTGVINAGGMVGTDLMLRSLTGGVFAESLQGITAYLRTLTGAIAVSDMACERLHVRTLCGQVLLSACCFLTGQSFALRSRAEMDLAGPFDALSVRCLFGSMTVYAPLDQADASLTSLSGRLHTDGVTHTAGAPRLRMQSVTADLQLICSLDTQAMI